MNIIAKSFTLLILTLGFVLATQAAQADIYKICKYDNCTEAKMKTIAIRATPDNLQGGNWIVHVGGYKQDLVRTYKVVKIVEREPGFEFTETFVIEQTVTSEVNSAVRTANKFIKDIKNGNFSASDLNAPGSTAADGMHEYDIRTLSQRVTDHFNNLLSSTVFESARKFNAITSSINDLTITINYADGSQTTYEVEKLAKNLTPGGLPGTITIDLNLRSATDNYGQQLPQNASDLNHIKTRRPVLINSSNHKTWKDALANIQSSIASVRSAWNARGGMRCVETGSGHATCYFNGQTPPDMPN
jgi:hypothetical protein